MKQEFPDLMLCLSTNGLLLPESIDRLYELGLHSLTVRPRAPPKCPRPPRKEEEA